MRINEAVGEFLKLYRKEHGLTMADVATASERYGSGWSSATIVSLERGGSKADSLPVLILLLRSLSDLTGDDLTLVDVFLDVPDNVDVLDLSNKPAVETSITTRDIADIINGEPINLVPHPPMGSEEYRKWFREYVDTAYAEATDAMRKLPPPAGVPVIAAMMRFHVPTAAEERAARKVDVPADVFGSWCIRLYGHSLDEEAKARAGEGASPQKRGRATRAIVEEVRAKIDEMAGRKAEAALNGDL